MKILTLMIFALTLVVPSVAQSGRTVIDTKVGNITISAQWVFLNGTDLNTLRIAVETTNPATDAYRVTFVLRRGPHTAKIVRVIVRNKEISYPSAEVYPFPAFMDIRELPSDGMIEDLSIDELAFSTLAAVAVK